MSGPLRQQATPSGDHDSPGHMTSDRGGRIERPLALTVFLGQLFLVVPFSSTPHCVDFVEFLLCCFSPSREPCAPSTLWPPPMMSPPRPPSNAAQEPQHANGRMCACTGHRVMPDPPAGGQDGAKGSRTRMLRVKRATSRVKPGSSYCTSNRPRAICRGEMPARRAATLGIHVDQP